MTLSQFDLQQIEAHEIAIERIKQGLCVGCGDENPMCHTCLGAGFKKKYGDRPTEKSQGGPGVLEE